jgi:hypothetical protein
VFDSRRHNDGAHRSDIVLTDLASSERVFDHRTDETFF